MAYVAGEPFLWPSLTSAETLEFLARLRGGTDVAYRDQLVERFQLDLRKKVRALSKGNRQKVQLIAALATRADLLLLDEPTSGLDPLMEVVFRECAAEAKARGQTRVPLVPHPQRGRGRCATGSGSCANGRLVDEGTLAELRHLGRADGRRHLRRCRRPSCRRWPACTVARAGPNALRFEVTGGHRRR